MMECDGQLKTSENFEIETTEVFIQKESLNILIGCHSWQKYDRSKV